MIEVGVGKICVETTVLVEVIVLKNVSTGKVVSLVARTVRVVSSEIVVPFNVTVWVLTVEYTVWISVSVVPFRKSVEMEVPCRFMVMVEVWTGRVVAFATVIMEEIVEVKVWPGRTLVLRM